MQAIPEITVAQAEARALQTVNAPPYDTYRPNLAAPSRKPLQLPNGWRFPYDLYISGFRIRQAILILFVDRYGKVEIERDDTTQIPNLQQFIQQPRAPMSTDAAASDTTVVERPPLTQKTQPSESAAQYSTAGSVGDDLPSLDDTFNQMRARPDGAQIETIEQVWDRGEAGWRLYWRLGLVRGLRRSVLLVGGRRRDIGVSDGVGEPQPHSFQRSAVQSWELGRAAFRANRLTVHLNDLLATESFLRSQWTVWSCMAYIGQYLTDLGYNDIGPQNVAIEFGAVDPGIEGAGFDVVRGVPTISFQTEGGWADDLSIIMHELGHAVWYLLFTRPPQSIDIQRHANELKGIEEGFADYTAATMLYRDTLVEIGNRVAKVNANIFHLPRVINVNPFPLPPEADLERIDPHDIGHKWANLLWDFRTQLIAANPVSGQRNADLAIFNAHLKPPVMQQGTAQPLACYFQSLAITAEGLLGNDSWLALAKRHDVSFTGIARYSDHSAVIDQTTRESTA